MNIQSSEHTQPHRSIASKIPLQPLIEESKVDSESVREDFIFGEGRKDQSEEEEDSSRYGLLAKSE